VVAIDAPYDVDVEQYPDGSAAIIHETLHHDFSDCPVMFKTLGITPSAEMGTGLVAIGPSGGKRALQIVTT